MSAGNVKIGLTQQGKVAVQISLTKANIEINRL